MYKDHGNDRLKRTYTISERTLRKFEELVPPGSRSQIVERLLNSEIEAAAREKLRKEIATGLDEMSQVYLEALKEWKSTDNEGWPKQ